jgi:hypothetical protein
VHGSLHSHNAAYIVLAQHSISRADHNGLMKLSKLPDWPKELFAWDSKAKLSAKLKKIGADAVMVVAVLAAASNARSGFRQRCPALKLRIPALIRQANGTGTGAS